MEKKNIHHLEHINLLNLTYVRTGRSKSIDALGMQEMKV
jgi:hypothetical protein